MVAQIGLATHTTLVRHFDMENIMDRRSLSEYPFLALNWTCSARWPKVSIRIFQNKYYQLDVSHRYSAWPYGSYSLLESQNVEHNVDNEEIHKIRNLRPRIKANYDRCKKNFRKYTYSNKYLFNIREILSHEQTTNDEFRLLLGDWKSISQPMPFLELSRMDAEDVFTLVPKFSCGYNKCKVEQTYHVDDAHAVH